MREGGEVERGWGPQRPMATVAFWTYRCGVKGQRTHTQFHTKWLDGPKEVARSKPVAKVGRLPRSGGFPGSNRSDC
jgi:hypothetical protein